jgi:hypothetical protein
MAWVLLAGWLVAIVVVVATGTRESSADDLRDAIARGEVHDVEASGALGGRTFGTVELRWREHGMHYTATAVRVPMHRHHRLRGFHETGPHPRFTGTLADYLTRGGGTVEIERTDGLTSGATTRALGWEVGGWVVALMIAALVLTLVTVATSEPWRATPWAWAWLILGFPVIAGPAYLLFGGPFGLAPPARPERRLTGGWAFLLSIVLGSALTAAFRGA